MRGLDYYTRTTFEFTGAALGAQSALAGGGRYDYLVEEIGGPATPGVGFGAGVERLRLALEEEGIRAEEEGIDFFFACGDGADRARVLVQMARLRADGVSCETDYAGRSLKGQLTQAGRLKARSLVLVTGGEAAIRAKGADERTVPVDAVAETIGG